MSHTQEDSCLWQSDTDLCHYLIYITYTYLCSWLTFLSSFLAGRQAAAEEAYSISSLLTLRYPKEPGERQQLWQEQEKETGTRTN